MTDEHLSDSDYIFGIEVKDSSKGYWTEYPTCDFCDEQSAFVMEFPHGSAYNGWVMCVECIKKHIEPVLTTIDGLDEFRG